MWRKSVVLIAICSAVPIVAQQPTAVLEAATITGNRFQSTFFKFGYQFPEGWTYLQRKKMSVENEAAYRKAADKALKENGPDSTTVSGNVTTTNTTKVYTPVNLLIATPTAIDTAASDSIPLVRIWAHQRLSAILSNAGDHAKLIAQMPKNRVLLPATKVSIDGHEFVRIDVRHGDGIYHSNIETVCGDYILGFDFYASTEKDLQALTDTLKSIHFN